MCIVYLCVLLIASTHARVALPEIKLSDISDNSIDDEKINTVEIQLVNQNEKDGKSVIDVTEINTTVASVPTIDPETEPNKHDNDTVVDICDNLIDINEIHCKSNNTNTKDNEEPLILTPLIEAGKLDEARNASKVTSDLFLGIESYTGFLTVNKTYNSNLFFWYFPIEGKLVSETQWIIWLQGGPGASSLTGLFDEIGPFKVNMYGELKRNPNSWFNSHSLLFIDSPVGSGYSFTQDKLGFVSDMETYSKHLYSAVEQFLQVFPELRTAPLYVAGESYAGKYVPCLATELHKHKINSEIQVNLRGLIVGNGYVEPYLISSLPRSFYNMGMIQKEQVALLQPLEDALTTAIAANQSVVAKEKWTSLLVVLLTLTNQRHAYNFLKDDFALGSYSALFLGRPDVKRAIHVGNSVFSFVNITTNVKLAPDFLTSTRSLFEALLENYRVLSFCGQLDQMLPCVTISESYRWWKWSGADAFRNATRFPYIYNNKLAGYHKSGGGFTEVVIRGAGHMVPLDMPEATQHLISNWTHHVPLTKNLILQTNFLRDYIRNNSIVL